MQFMYADESGDPGYWDHAKPAHLNPSPHYILTGFILEAEKWKESLEALIGIRRQVCKKYCLPARTEMHGVEIVNPRSGSPFKCVKGGRRARVALYREFLEGVATQLLGARIINVYLDKRTPKCNSSSSRDIEATAWEYLLQRFENYLRRSKGGDFGMVFADDANEKKIRRTLRKMRRFNYTPSHFGGSYQNTAELILEDPNFRRSHHSLMVQVADMASHSLYRREHAKPGYKKHNIDRLFNVLDPILLKVASRSDPHGVVRM